MRNFVRVLAVCILVGSIARVATPQAATLYGEAPNGVQKGLGGTLGQLVSWANPNTILYTCTNPNGFVVLHVVPRNPNGTQPLSFTLSVVPGGGTSTAFSTGLALVNGIFNAATTQIVTGTMGQSLIVTPVTTTTGTAQFDVLGYEGI